MSAWANMVWIVFMALAAGWVLAACAAHVLAGSAGDRRLAPAAQIRRAWLVALLPWIVPLLLLAALLVPAAAKPLGLIADHCLFHGTTHPHLCLAHLPALALQHWHWSAISLACAWIIFAATRHLARRRRQVSRIRSMAALAHGRGPLRVLDTDACVAFAAHAGRPLVLVSRGLLQRLGPRQRRIVLAHEAAHLRHGDPRGTDLFEWLLLAHWPVTASRLRHAWHQAIEERADDRVAARFGGEAVAQTVVAAVRAATGREAPALSAAGADTLRRVERLLGHAAAARDGCRYELAYGTALLLMTLAVADAHHAVETLLGVLT